MTLIETTRVSIARPQVSTRLQAVLIAEIVALYVLPPTTFFLLREAGYPVPTIPAALAGTLVFGILIARDPTFDRKALWRRPKGLGRSFKLFALSAVFLTVVTLLVLPDNLLRLPVERTWLWAAIMIYYPLLSVIPQELIYRAYFFHRYRPLFGSTRRLIFASAVMFGWVHIMFGHWLSVALTFAGGLVFAWTWVRTRSLWAVAIEHAVYGCFVFTIGLRPYFYGGAQPF